MSNFSPVPPPVQIAPPPWAAAATYGAVSPGLYRAHDRLLTVGSPEFPDCCVRCNAPAEGYRKRVRLRWHAPLWYVLVLVQPMVYLIVALIVSKSVTLDLPLCERHRARRRLGAIILWVSLLVMICGVVASAGTNNGAYAGIGALIFFILLIVGVVLLPIVQPVKIDDMQRAWLKRVSPEFLEPLPQGPYE